jgi:hypothetical protein
MHIIFHTVSESMVSGASKKKKKKAAAALSLAGPTSSLLKAVYTRLANTLHAQFGLVLVQNKEKGRYCRAPPQGFEPGRVLLEEEAYM